MLSVLECSVFFRKHRVVSSLLNLNDNIHVWAHAVPLGNRHVMGVVLPYPEHHVGTSREKTVKHREKIVLGQGKP